MHSCKKIKAIIYDKVYAINVNELRLVCEMRDSIRVARALGSKEKDIS